MDPDLDADSVILDDTTDASPEPLSAEGASSALELVEAEDLIFGYPPSLNYPPSCSEEQERSDTDWLFDFDDTPISLSDDDEEMPIVLNERGVEEKASFLMGEIAILRQQDAESVFDRCLLLLEHFPHYASYMAMRRLLASGLTLDDLEEVARLKLEWRDDPTLWLTRSKGEFHRKPLLKTALSWKTAAALVERFGIIEATEMLQGEWLTRWSNLSAPPLDEPVQWNLYRSFPIFLGHLVIAPDVPDQRSEVDSWFYEEVTERLPHGKLRLPGGNSDSWRFSRDNYRPYETKLEFLTRHS